MKAVAVLFVLSAALLILIILMQKGRGGGLSAAFGGGMAGGILGSKTGDFLTWVTIVLVGFFLGLALLMAKFYRPTIAEFGTEKTVQQQPSSDVEPPVPADQNQPQAFDVNEIADVNSPG